MDLLRVPSSKTVLAFGMQWRPLDPFENKHKQITDWKNEGNKVQAVYVADKEAMYGLSRDDILVERKDQVAGCKVLSGAACAAKLPQLRGKNALVTIEVEDPGSESSTTVIVGLHHGRVVVDQLVEGPAQVAEARQRYTAIVGPIFEVHGVSRTISPVQHALELRGLVPKSTLFMTGPKVESLRSGRMPVVAGAVAVTLMSLAGGLYAWDSHQADVRQRLAAQMMLRNQPAVQYQQNVQRLLQAPVVPLAGALRTLRVALADFPLAHAGWDLNRLTCTPTGDCAVRFTRIAGSGASITDFRNTAPPSWLGITAMGQTELVFNLRVPLPSARLSRSTWPTAAQHRERSFAAWQFLEPGGWRAEFAQVSLQAVPADLKPEQVASLNNSPDAIYAMPLTIVSQPWWYLDDDVDSPVTEHMLGDNTAMVGDIDIVLSNREITFSAKGLTYVQR